MSSPPESFYPDSKTAKAQKCTAGGSGTLIGVLFYRSKSRKQDSKCHKEWDEIPLLFLSFPTTAPRDYHYGTSGAKMMGAVAPREPLWGKKIHSDQRSCSDKTMGAIPTAGFLVLFFFSPQFLCFLVPKQMQSWELWSRSEKVKFALLAEVLEKAEGARGQGNFSEIIEGREMKISIP